MTVRETFKAFDNKIKQNSVKYNSDIKNAKSFTLSSGNVSKYEVLNSKDVLPGKDLLGKAAIIKRFEYSPLGKELQAQTGIAKDQYKKQPICATR